VLSNLSKVSCNALSLATFSLSSAIEIVCYSYK
ncbi:MAG: hypothetical protein ACI9LI_000175, partial [Saprospiraceae bacterium]